MRAGTLARTAVAAVLTAATLAVAVTPARADMAASYPDTVFSDGFELGAPWTSQYGSTVSLAAASAGSYGLRLQGSYAYRSQLLATPLTRSATVSASARRPRRASRPSPWAVRAPARRAPGS
jgi:hypothetical protein